MLSKVVLSATFAATLVLTPAVLANNDVDLEVDGVALVDDGFVAEDAIAGRDLLGRKKHRSPKALQGVPQAQVCPQDQPQAYPQAYRQASYPSSGQKPWR
jgi:hypothetical protein